jgi:outer membrane protein
MLRQGLLGLGIYLLLGAGPGLAQDTAPAEAQVPAALATDQPAPPAAPPGNQSSAPLSLPDCIDLALQHNPRTSAAWAAYRAASERVGVARAEWWPKVQAGASVGVSEMSASQANVGTMVGGRDGLATQGSLSVSWLLFDAARGARVDAALAGQDVAQGAQRALLLTLAMEAREAFMGVQGALWYQAAVEELVKQADYQQRLAAARFEVGLARRYDVLQAQARVAELEAQRSTAAAALRQARGTLARTLGEDVRWQPELLPLEENPDPAAVAELDELLAEAKAARPELAQAQAQVASALAQARVAGAGHLPTVTAQATVARNYDKDWNSMDNKTATLGLTIPLFSGFGTVHSVRAARYDEQQARAQLAGAVNDIQFEVWAAHAGIAEARDGLTARERVLEAANEAAALAEENYKLGLGSIVELLDAQASRASARVQALQARIDWYLALSRLDKAVGRVLTGPGGTR